MSASSLLLSLAALATFGYSVYFMNTNPQVLSMHKLMPPELRKYGHVKFLTYQCLCIQLLSAFLHVLSHLSSFFVKPRDFVFNSLAYPIGSIVCYTFWAVWFLLGRELIFPKALDAYYPSWLNHATHSIIIPINLLLALMINHKFSSRQFYACIIYFAFYTIFLHYIKYDTGVFVYRYLEVFNEFQRIIYFLATGLMALVMVKSGELLGKLAHGSSSSSQMKGKASPKGGSKKQK